MSRRTPRQNNIDARLGTLEAHVDHVSVDLRQLTKSVQELTEKISKGTNWGVLGTWSAVLISIVGALGFLALAPVRETQQRDDARLDRIEAALHHHETIDAHPEARAKLAALQNDYERSREDLKRTDTALQREMRDLDRANHAALQTAISALDKRLQSEMAIRDDVVYWKTRAERAELRGPP